jgi:predicted ATPase
VTLTTFVGRERELIEVQRLIGFRRLLTLTGGGGVGKTRLAIEAARRLSDRDAGDICWIDLAPLAAPSRPRSALHFGDPHTAGGRAQIHKDSQARQTRHRRLEHRNVLPISPPGAIVPLPTAVMWPPGCA